MKILFIIIALLPFYSSAQKIEIDKIDPFDSIRYVSTEAELIRGKKITSPDYASVSVSRYTNASYLKKDTTFRIGFMFITPLTGSTGPDNNIVFMMEDNSIIRIKNSGSYDIEYSGGLLGLTGAIDEHIEILLSKEIVKIRLESSVGGTDIDLKDGKRSIIKNQILAIIKHR